MSNKKLVTVRFKWPKDVHKKIRTYQKRISLAKDKDYTFEEASIEYIRATEAVA